MKVLTFLATTSCILLRQVELGLTHLAPPGLSNRDYTVFSKAGDINLGYIADIRSPDNIKKKCGDFIIPSSCATMATAFYAVDAVNKRSDILPNITLGLVTVDACYDSLFALESVMYFIPEGDEVVKYSCNSKASDQNCKQSLEDDSGSTSIVSNSSLQSSSECNNTFMPSSNLCSNSSFTMSPINDCACNSESICNCCLEAVGDNIDNNSSISNDSPASSGFKSSSISNNCKTSDDTSNNCINSRDIICQSTKVTSNNMKTYNVKAVIGPSISDIAAVVSPLMGIYRIPTMGLFPTTDELSNKLLHPYFTRLVAPSRVVVQGLLDIAEYFAWSYVSLVYSEGSYGESSASQVERLIRDMRYTICLAVSIKLHEDASEEDLHKAFDTLMEFSSARIVFLFIDTDLVGHFMKVVQDRVGPGVFLWLGSNSLVPVSLAEGFMDVLEGSIFLNHINDPVPGYDDYMKSTALWNDKNIWYVKAWQDAYKCVMPDKNAAANNISQCVFNPALVKRICSYDSWVGRSRIYDAVSVLSDALHRLITENCPRGFQNKTLLDNCVNGELLLHYILSTRLHGLIGNIEFTKEGDVLETFSVQQFQKNLNNYNKKNLGTWNSTSRFKYLPDSALWNVFNLGNNENETTGNESEKIIGNGTITDDKVLVSVCSQPCLPSQYLIRQSSPCCWICATCRNNEVISPNQTSCQSCPAFYWPDPRNPSSCLVIPPIYLTTTDPVSIVMLGLAALGAASILCVMGVYVVYDHHKLVMATSRDLCLAILTGSLLACITVVFYILKPSKVIVCHLRRISFHISINLIYGPLLIKNIRIYRIFKKNGNQKMRYVSNSWQMIFVSMELILQSLTVILVEIFGPPHSALVMPSPYEPYVELYCKNSPTSFVIPLVYNILIIVLCSFIGFLTRKLPDNFNESWFIFISASTTLFAWAVFLPAYFTTFRTYLQSAILGFCLILNCYVTVGCLFAPVLYAVAFVPSEKLKFSIVTSSVAPASFSHAE